MKRIAPQTRAEKIGKYGCLAFCYLYCCGIEPDNASGMIKYVSSAIDRGLLDEDCFVKDAKKFIFHFTGRNVEVIKKDITSISEIKAACPVRFDYANFSHWVVVENGKIIFNSLEKSTCVKYGKPTTARIIKYI